MKLRFFVCLSFLSFVRITCWSQENYIPGYVVLSSLDTVHGYIDQRAWDVTPEKISFKRLLNGEKKTFSAGEIQEFKTKHVRYVAADVQVEVSPQLVDELDSTSTFRFVSKRVFLEELVQGSKSLYFFANKKRRPFFYVGVNGRYELLKYKVYFKLYPNQLLNDPQPQKFVQENKTFLAEIGAYLDNCQIVNSNLKNTRYQASSLVKLFKYYSQQCGQNANIKIHEAKNPYKFRFGVRLTNSITNLRFSGDLFLSNYPGRTNFDTPTNFGFGLSGEFVHKSAKREFSVGSELIYSSLTNKGSFSVVTTPTNYSKFTTELDIAMLKFNSIARLRYPIKRLYYNVLGGVQIGYFLNQNSKKIDEILTPSMTSPTVQINTVKIFSSSLSTAIIAGTGISYDRLMFEIRYELGLAVNGPIELTSFSSEGKINSLVFIVGYNF